MASSPELVSAVAAVVSAVGGACAAWAAFRSADSARASQRSAEDAERRASLRQIAVSSSEIITEAKRVESRAAETKLSYNALAVFSGSVGNSAIGARQAEVDAKVLRAAALSSHAKLFVDRAVTLSQAPTEELDRVQFQESAALIQVRALREDLELELSGLQAQLGERREDMLKAKYAR